MTIKTEIIPAIIAKNQEELSKNINKVINFVDWIQLDIMDDQFVPNTSLFFDFQLPSQPCSYEAHLMVQHPEEWIEKHIEKVDTVLVHYESDFDMKKIISLVKQKNKKIGFVINPETPVNVLFEVLDEIDQVLIMTVKPGFYGSTFLPEMAGKIRELRKRKPSFDIEVDGGITPESIALVHEAGANLFVSGSFIVKADNPAESIETLKEIIKKNKLETASN
ncbi:MAG: ribulose-phosphate 3-epimerase [Thermoplasmatota archaeon]